MGGNHEDPICKGLIFNKQCFAYRRNEVNPTAHPIHIFMLVKLSIFIAILYKKQQADLEGRLEISKMDRYRKALAIKMQSTIIHAELAILGKFI